MTSSSDYNHCTNNTNSHMSQEMTMATTPSLRSRLNMLKSDIIKSFQDLGITAHKPPRSKDNRAPVAWEFFTAYTLKASAEVRYKKAVREAVKVGVLFDHEKEPLPAGTNKVLYVGDQVTVRVEVRSPYERVDADKLVSFLVGRSVSKKDLDEAVAYATSMTKPPHVFKAEITE